MQSLTSRLTDSCERLSVWFTRLTTSSIGFGCALLLILIWCISGPVFQFSTRWESVLTTGTAIATFLMVFLLQRAQAKDMQALHIKLNELIASHIGASNRMLNIESASESELAAMRDLHDRLPKGSMESHSLEHVRERELIIGQPLVDQSNQQSIIIAEH